MIRSGGSKISHTRTRHICLDGAKGELRRGRRANLAHKLAQTSSDWLRRPEDWRPQTGPSRAAAAERTVRGRDSVRVRARGGVCDGPQPAPNLRASTAANKLAGRHAQRRGPGRVRGRRRAT